jgi:hypothetical protein
MRCVMRDEDEDEIWWGWMIPIPGGCGLRACVVCDVM